MASGKELRTLKRHDHWVLSVCFSPDGKQLATAGYDKKVKVWDTATGQETLSLTGHESGVYSVCFSPDGTRLASGSNDKTVKVWDAATGQALLSLTEFKKTVVQVCFSPDGTQLAASAHDVAKLWDVGTGRIDAEFEMPGAISFRADGKRLAFAYGPEPEVSVLDAATGHARHR